MNCAKFIVVSVFSRVNISTFVDNNVVNHARSFLNSFMFVETGVNNGSTIWKYKCCYTGDYVVFRQVRGNIVLTVHAEDTLNNRTTVNATLASSVVVYDHTYKATENCVACEFREEVVDALVKQNRMTQNQKCVLIDRDANIIRGNRVLVHQRFLRQKRHCMLDKAARGTYCIKKYMKKP